MLIIGIVLIVVSIILIIYSYYNLHHTKEINHKVEMKNIEIEMVNKELEKTKCNLVDNIKEKEIKLHEIEQSIVDRMEQAQEWTDHEIEQSKKAFQNYCQLLEKEYEEKEQEYEMYTDAMETAYSNKQLELMREVQDTEEYLNKLKLTRAAAIEAQSREEEIKENKDNYRLNISDLAQKDIRLLNSIKTEISNPSVVDKIIWSSYYQPLAKNKFPKIIGKETVCGIYKITSLISGMCYIGQSRDCCDRWKQHCKNALGVGTSATTNNKLYQTIKKEGLNNFTFEILEECEAKYLDEKESYYISLYDSYNFGMNGTRGNNKN